MDTPQSPPPFKPILESTERLEMRVRAAERAHDDETEFAKGANQAAIKAAEEAIKATLLINGGSSVAMLAFIGTIASKDVFAPSHLMQIAKPLIVFGAGVALSVVGAACAYFCNLMIAGSASRKTRHYEEPFLRPTPSSRRHWLWGEIFRYCGVIAVLGAIVCFVAGLVAAQDAFKAVSEAQVAPPPPH